MDYLEKAKKILHEEGFTCVICGENTLYTSHDRGVKPLLEPYSQGLDFCGCEAADKVIGKAAACLYVLLGVNKVYADIVSLCAVSIFEKYGVELRYEQQVPLIENRSRTGICPMETALMSVDDVRNAPEVIRQTIESLWNAGLT